MADGLPRHIIDQLNNNARDREQAIFDAVTRARYEERDRAAAIVGTARDCMAIVKLLRYNAQRDCYEVSGLDLAANRLSVPPG